MRDLENQKPLELSEDEGEVTRIRAMCEANHTQLLSLQNPLKPVQWNLSYPYKQEDYDLPRKGPIHNKNISIIPLTPLYTFLGYSVFPLTLLCRPFAVCSTSLVVGLSFPGLGEVL